MKVKKPITLLAYMNKYIFLIPVFNDWKSLNKLLKKIDENISMIKGNFKAILINDCSTSESKFNISKLKKIKKVHVFNLKKNSGSQKSISIGLRYLKRQKAKSIITIIDSDGEDDPSKIKNLIELAIKNPKHIITANRLQRNESYFLRFLNIIRLYVTYLITGRYIDFGNYTSFQSTNLKNLLSNSNSWLAHPAAVLKNCKNIKPYYIKKKKRYFGKSHVGFKFLINHSINIILVFKTEIFTRLIIIYFLSLIFFSNVFLITFIMVFILTILTFIYRKINYDFSRSTNMISSIKKY
jgi:hypothetical protein